MLPGSPAQAGSVLGSFPQLPTCWGAGLRQLDCRTGLPLNSISLGSLLYVRHRAVYTEGGDQLWGGDSRHLLQEAEPGPSCAPKIAGASLPNPLLLRCSPEGALGDKELFNIRPSLGRGDADETKIETARTAAAPSPALAWPLCAAVVCSPSAFPRG